MYRSQSGFTLIELIMVIVILGILAATALPRFVDLSDQAETAALDGAEGALQSAAAITYAEHKANGNSGLPDLNDVEDNLTLDGFSINSSACSDSVEIEHDDSGETRDVDLTDYCSG